MEERFETFTGLMTTINRSIRKIKTEEMAKYTLKSPHVTCLFYLYKEGALTAKTLCERCEEDKANISRSIDYLEKNGYIVCHSQSAKRYRCPLELTEKGSKIGREISQKIDSMLLKASDGLNEEHKLIMYECLAQINDNLQKICEEYSK